MFGSTDARMRSCKTPGLRLQQSKSWRLRQDINWRPEAQHWRDRWEIYATFGWRKVV